MNANQLCVPAQALAEATEDGGQTLEPQPGDNVELTLSGRIERSENGLAYITPTAVNGTPLGPAGGDMGEPSMADEDEAMKSELGRYASILLLVLGFVLCLLGGAPAQAADGLVLSQSRTCSGGAVSNYVARASETYVYNAEINNFSGSTLYLLIFDSATNQLAGAVPHFTAVPIPTGSVGGKNWATGAPFYYGVNVCLSTTPFSLTNASAGGTATIIHTGGMRR
jgi:hypothetical protein